MSPLHKLELTLWTRETRFDRALMDAPDVHEFGRSRRRSTRDQNLYVHAKAQSIDATGRVRACTHRVARVPPP